MWQIAKLLVVLFPVFVWAQGPSPVTFDHAEIKIADRKIMVEVARTPEQLSRGLMFRRKIEADQGMLFIYHKEEQLSFWMKNTFVPLSIGFFDKNKKLVDIQEMRPVLSEMQMDIPTYKSRAWAQYALEMPAGWFKKNGIRVGAQFDFVSKVSP